MINRNLYILIAFAICTVSLKAQTRIGNFKKAIYSMDISPDGKILAFTSGDSLILWNLSERETIEGYQTNVPGNLLSIDYSTNGSKIAAGGTDSCIVIIDLSLQKSIRKIKGPKGVITSVKFSPDDNYLAAACSDHSIYIWQSENIEKVTILAGHSKDVTDIEFLNSTQMAGCDAEGNILIWDFIENKVISNFKAHKGWIRDIELRDDNQTLVSCGDDARINSWKMESNQNPKLKTSIKRGGNWLNSIGLYGNDFIVSASLDRKVYVDSKYGYYSYKTKAFVYKVLFIPETIPFKIIYCTLNDGIFLLEAENMKFIKKRN